MRVIDLHAIADHQLPQAHLLNGLWQNGLSLHILCLPFSPFQVSSVPVTLTSQAGLPSGMQACVSLDALQTSSCNRRENSGSTVTVENVI